MYQTREIRHEKRRLKSCSDRVYYTYEEGWFSKSIKSEDFANEEYKGSNPTNGWPFHSQTINADNVNLGAYYLSDTQIS